MFARFCAAGLVCVALAFLPAASFAQGSQGQITGRVTDPSGSPVLGAAVTLSNISTAQTKATTTNAEGYYTFPALQPSQYTVNVQMQGFKKTVTNLTLEVNQTLNNDIALQLGTVDTLVVGAARFMLGVGEGACFPAATRGAAEYAPLERRSFATGFAIGGSALGAVLAPPLTVLAAARFGWRGTFLLTGIIGAIWILVWIVAVPYKPQERSASSVRWVSLVQDKRVLWMLAGGSCSIQSFTSTCSGYRSSFRGNEGSR